MEGEELHEHHEGMGSASGSGGQTESELQKRESILSHLPSPPLTRVGTRESGWKSEAAEGDIELGELGDANSVETGTGKKVEEEKDLAELDLSGMDPNQTVVGEGCSVVEESTPPKPIRRNSALHLAIHPPSPQPWEIIDPPDSDDDIERYPRAGPKRFDVIQNQLRCVNVFFFLGFGSNSSFPLQCSPTTNTQVRVLFRATTSGFRIWHSTNRTDRTSSSSRNLTDREGLYRRRANTIRSYLPSGTCWSGSFGWCSFPLFPC